MNKRDMDVLLFINQVKICTTKQIKETFFPGLHHSICYNKLNNYIDGKLIKRKYMNINKNTNSYVYYYDKPPSKKNLKHDLLISEVLAQLIQNNYELIHFEKNPIVGGIIPDAEIKFKSTSKTYNIFLEVQLSDHDCTKKYYNLKNKVNREIPDILLIISNNKINIQKLRYFQIIQEDVKMNNLKEVFK